MTLDHVPGDVKASVDFLSAGIAVGTVAQLLPHVAAILTIFWTLIRIYETDTMQRLLKRSVRVEAAAASTIVDEEKLDG